MGDIVRSLTWQRQRQLHAVRFAGTDLGNQWEVKKAEDQFMIGNDVFARLILIKLVVPRLTA